MQQGHNTIYIFTTHYLNQGLFKNSEKKICDIHSKIFDFHFSFKNEFIDKIINNEVEVFKPLIINKFPALKIAFDEDDFPVIKNTLKKNENEQILKGIIYKYLSQDYLSIYQLTGYNIFSISCLKSSHPRSEKSNNNYVLMLIESINELIEEDVFSSTQSIKVILHDKDTELKTSNKFLDPINHENVINALLGENEIKNKTEIYLFQHQSDDFIFQIIQDENVVNLYERLNKNLDLIKIPDEDIEDLICNIETKEIDQFIINDLTNNKELINLLKDAEYKDFKGFLIYLHKLLKFRKLNNKGDFDTQESSTENEQTKNFLKKAEENVFYSGYAQTFCYKCLSDNRISENLNYYIQKKRKLIFLSIVDFNRRSFIKLLEHIVNRKGNNPEFHKILIICRYNYFMNEEFKNVLTQFINVNRTFLFFDSNIWVRSLSFDELIMPPKDLEIDNDIFNLNIAEEFIEFQERLFKQSHLDDKDSHGIHVSPFVFHSETKMKQEIEDRILKKINFDLDWNSLLVDDYANLPLSPFSVQKKYERLTKKNIIKYLLSFTRLEIISVYDDDDNSNLIWKTLKKLSVNTYDIIFLDYLLGDNDQRINQREYSHELLLLLDGICSNKSGFRKNDFLGLIEYLPENWLIYNTHQNKYEVSNWEHIKNINKVIEGIKQRKGPLGKFWFFNISSFQSAFLDRLREQGLGHNSEHWFLSRGADPVNTPELFRYSLFNFLLLQQKQAIFTIENLVDFFCEKGNIEALNNSFNADKWARTIFGSFIHRFYSKDILKKDMENGSKFAKSVIELANEDNNAISSAYNLVEHFRHLLYLLAFDSGMNMQIAWEELRLIRRKLNSLDSGGTEISFPPDKKEKIFSIFNKIEIYIDSVLPKD